MDKPFLTLDEQVLLLERRGCACGKQTKDILLKEGYYPVVNGYNTPFLANPDAGGEHFREGTSFDDLYRLFLFDRDLRELTFRYLTRIEAVVRNTCAYRFSIHHRKTLDYLREGCYTDAAHYVNGTSEYDRDLDGLLNTLGRLSSGEGSSKAGVRYYVANHDGVPLWVLVGDLTFGNVRHLFDLLEHKIREDVCDDVCRLMHPEVDDERYITPAWMSRALENLVEARNICAHDDRLFNHAYDPAGTFGYRDMLGQMDRLITTDEAAERDATIARLADDYLAGLPQIREQVLGTNR